MPTGCCATVWSYDYQHPATHRTTLCYTANMSAWMPTVYCSTLQYTATHCNTLQLPAPHCNTPHHTANTSYKTVESLVHAALSLLHHPSLIVCITHLCAHICIYICTLTRHTAAIYTRIGVYMSAWMPSGCCATVWFMRALTHCDTLLHSAPHSSTPMWCVCWESINAWFWNYVEFVWKWWFLNICT